MRQSGLEVVGTFWFLHEADIAKAMLESDGIPAWVLDQNTIRTDWLLTGALGNVKLAVSPEDAERAHELLSADHSAALASAAEHGLPAHPEERCPACGSAAVAARSVQALPGVRQWLVTLISLAVGLVVPRRRFVTERFCATCDHRWSSSSAR
jgi:hypothetical protein